MLKSLVVSRIFRIFAAFLGQRVVINVIHTLYNIRQNKSPWRCNCDGNV